MLSAVAVALLSVSSAAALAIAPANVTVTTLNATNSLAGNAATTAGNATTATTIQQLVQFIPSDLNSMVVKDYDGLSTFQVLLTQQPPNAVSLFFAASGLRFQECSVTFTPQNYNQPQNVTFSTIPTFATPNGTIENANVPVPLSVVANAPGLIPAGDNSSVVSSVPGTQNFTLQRQVIPAGTVTAWGDPHFVTADGTDYDFQGNGTYYLIKSSSIQVQITTFMCSPIVSCIREVGISYGQSTIVLALGGSDPNNPTVGLSSASLQQASSSIQGLTFNETQANIAWTINVNNGVVITLSIQGLPWALAIGYINIGLIVPSNMAGTALGLAGLFDGNKTNDFVTPTGQTVTDPILFGQSWAVPDTDNIMMGNTPQLVAPFLWSPQVCAAPTQEQMNNATDNNNNPQILAQNGYQVLAQYAPNSTLVYGNNNGTYAFGNNSVPANFSAIVQQTCSSVLTSVSCEPFVNVTNYIRACVADCEISGSIDAYLESTKQMMLKMCHLHTNGIAQNQGAHSQYVVQAASNISAANGLGQQSCPNNCSSQGQCASSGCVCNSNWSGADCSIDVSAIAQPANGGYGSHLQQAYTGQTQAYGTNGNSNGSATMSGNSSAINASSLLKNLTQNGNLANVLTGGAAQIYVSGFVMLTSAVASVLLF